MADLREKYSVSLHRRGRKFNPCHAHHFFSQDNMRLAKRRHTALQCSAGADDLARLKLGVVKRAIDVRIRPIADIIKWALVISVSYLTDKGP